jgi:hypothetical protein
MRDGILAPLACENVRSFCLSCETGHKRMIFQHLSDYAWGLD